MTDDARPVVAVLAEARRRGLEVVVSALTVIEAVHAKTNRARLAWLLSGIRVEAVDESTARLVSQLLIESGLHGHKYAIDGVVAELASRQRPPVVSLTSDIDDMKKLCGSAVRLIST
ncbi:DNA-binding protein [Nocardia sp. AG03]|uniref:DNA-binding protein n=1 Tax=Nocardia sp. AG03 TaxID=3025312 RepID=UPI00241823A9|nr:DNA-binding protein [Nocardia sp. AG03]